jgi:hypothetical protein
MSSVKLLLVVLLGSAACRPTLAQEAQPLAGASDCRFAVIHRAPMGAPAWDGACKAGFADGKGTLSWRDPAGKAYKLEAILAAGQVAGEAKLQLPNGAVYIGPFRDGMPDGRGYFHFANGTRYEGDVRMGQRTGTGEALYANGDSYKGEWKNGKRDGTGVHTYILGGRYEGGWAHDKPSGPGKVVFAGSPGREMAVVDGRVPDRPATPIAKASYTLKEDQLRTSSMILRDVAREIPVPPNLPYDKLSEEQQATVKRWFPALAPGDEPPYPLHGPAPFYQTVQRIVSATGQQGSISVYVLVDKDGKTASVTTVGQDKDGLPPEVSKAVGMAAGLVAYKPAMCDGQPCEMMYPYRLALTLER